ncbi:hypothetical protein HanIR_Chr04g0159521 [Helianthus annuus]|nr:hypothetical protein HanIR_Chr04g0159521 [Helianthus annuus]
MRDLLCKKVKHEGPEITLFFSLKNNSLLTLSLPVYLSLYSATSSSLIPLKTSTLNHHRSNLANLMLIYKGRRRKND